MQERNPEIKKAAKDAGIRLWRIAEKLGITDSNFSRLLRRELSEKKKREILGIIEALEIEDECDE